MKSQALDWRKPVLEPSKIVAEFGKRQSEIGNPKGALRFYSSLA
jgi:hypothetical protein